MRAKSADPVVRRLASEVEIEAAVTAAIRTIKGCEAFVGVIVGHANDRGPSNEWIVRGIRYGRAPRDKCDSGLESVCEELRKQLMVSKQTRARP